MEKTRKISWVGIGRKTTACCLCGIGIWVLGLVAPLPNLQHIISQTVNHPRFITHTLGTTTTQNYNSFTEYTISQWGWLETVPVMAEESSPVIPQIEEVVEELQILPAVPQPVQREEVQEETQPTQSLSGHWIPKTMLPSSAHVQVGDLYIANSGKVSLSDATVPVFSPLILEDSSYEPQILIYHSHGTESYSPSPGYEYEESDPYRSLQEGRNIISVGEAMAEVFETAGYGVIHDQSYHDYPDYNSSYSNSGVSTKQYLEDYPSISLVLDVHRDALEDINGVPYQMVSQQDGESVAQVMLVVGTNGDGYAHDQWRENLDLALSIQTTMMAYGDFARPLTLRSSRFNQHLSTGALLVEVGGHGNTLEQAVAAGRLFAESVVETLRGKD